MHTSVACIYLVAHGILWIVCSKFTCMPHFSGSKQCSGGDAALEDKSRPACLSERHDF